MHEELYWLQSKHKGNDKTATPFSIDWFILIDNTVSSIFVSMLHGKNKFMFILFKNEDKIFWYRNDNMYD